VEALRSKGAKTIGILGFCWGASISLQGGSDASFSAAAGVHPAFFGRDKQLAEAVLCPVALLPAQGDAMESVKEVLDTRWGTGLWGAGGGLHAAPCQCHCPAQQPTRMWHLADVCAAHSRAHSCTQ
jgi:hypothetical protein